MYYSSILNTTLQGWSQDRAVDDRSGQSVILGEIFFPTLASVSGGCLLLCTLTKIMDRVSEDKVLFPVLYTVYRQSLGEV